MTDPDVPLLSRSADPERDTAPIRLDLPVSLVAVLDFIANREKTTRKELVERFTRAGLQEHLMDARMLVRMVDSNAPSVD